MADKEIKDQKIEDTNQEKETIVDDTNSETINIEQIIETPEDKYAELNDRFLRLYAEFDNYRKRTNKERVDLILNANAGVLTDLIPVLDDLERAKVNNEKTEEIDLVKEGFNLIYTKFSGILEAKGLKPMVAKGKPFDSELHEAIANIPASSNKEKGKVVEDVEKGYYLHDKVIRFAKVVVGQ